MPNGATPVDFAYTIHSEIGSHCVGAKINEKIVPLDYPLKNGDVTEILTNKNSNPNQFWLNFVRTSHAKQRIKAWFRSQDIDKIIKSGKELLNKQLKRLGHNELDPHLLLLKNYNNKKITSKEREHILEKIGNGTISPMIVIKKLFPKDTLISPQKVKKENLSNNPLLKQPKVIVSGEDIYKTKLAACCKPTDRDKIVGYVTRGNYISIHNINCNTVQRLRHKERLIDAHWSNEHKKHRVKLILKALDRIGLIHDITQVFLLHKINIISMESGDPSLSPGLHQLTFNVEIENVDRLNHILNRLEGVESVSSVKRVMQK